MHLRKFRTITRKFVSFNSTTSKELIMILDCLWVTIFKILPIRLVPISWYTKQAPSNYNRSHDNKVSP